MTMRRRRLRLTIAGIMGIVAFIAAILGSLLEAHRIRRTQAFYLRESAKYAQLEKGENNQVPLLLRAARLEKEFIEDMLERDSERDERMRDHFYAPSRFAPDTERYRIHLERGRKYLTYVDNARINAKRYSDLSRQYKEAGTRLWLPFGPNPLRRGD
jgi:hypothetical protein